MKEELAEIKTKYGDERKTKIVAHGVSDISAKDTIPNEPMVVALTLENYIKRMPPNTFRTQHRGGKGVMGMTTKEEDEIKIICHTKTTKKFYFSRIEDVYLNSCLRNSASFPRFKRTSHRKSASIAGR